MCILAIIQSFRNNRVTVQTQITPDSIRIQNGALVISMGAFITEFFRSASSVPSGAKFFVNEMVLFIRKMLPSFSLDMRIVSPPCFVCSVPEGLEVGCSVPGCLAMCHPLCLKQQLRIPSVLSYLRTNNIFCPFHHSQNLRAMKCPRNKADSVPPVVSRSPLPVASRSLTISSNSSLPVTSRSSLPVTSHSSLSMTSNSPMPTLARSSVSSFSAKPKPKRSSTPAVPKPAPTNRTPSPEREASSPKSEDDGEVCDICGMGYSEPDDMLVFCDRCNLAVHQGCYGVSKLPEGEWLCSVCRRGRLPSETFCCVCLHAGGAMHPTADGRFVHLICVYYTPELSLDLRSPEVIVRGVENIVRERAQLVCCICGKRGAGCIQCNYRSCSTAYHPYCALKAGFLLTSDEKNGRFMYLSYCGPHSKLREKKERSTPSTPEKKRKRQSRKKREKKETLPPPPVIPTKALEKDAPFLSTDFWQLIRYIYVVKPTTAYLPSLFHFLPLRMKSAEPSDAKDVWIPPQLLDAARWILETDLRRLSEEAKLTVLQTNMLFTIPALGHLSLRLLKMPFSDPLVRTVSMTPYQSSGNSSLKRTQVQRFQGFDINDFADLRESYDCHVDEPFVEWAKQHAICCNTRFRRAYRTDVHWLLRLNTINPTFSKESDYSGTFVEKNEFVIIAERRNPRGDIVPVGMVHYYLMWYYPCAGKQREAVRAVYVCTLQRVAPETHARFIEQYGVEAEPYTGAMLLSLAFLHGKKCGMTMGCCDSTDNSVSFYTDQFDMKALPRGEGRHYTPMQLSLSDFNPRNTLLRHVPSRYRATLLCSVDAPLTSQVAPSVDTQKEAAGCLHLQYKTRCMEVVGDAAGDSFEPLHNYIRREYPLWLTGTASGDNVSDLGRRLLPFSVSRNVYFHNNVPHFVELPSESEETQEVSSPLKLEHMALATCVEEPQFVDSNEVERSLERAQEELYELMCQNDKSLSELVVKLAAAEPASDETLGLVNECKRLQEELQDYTLSKRPELAREKEDEDDNDAICEVCGDGNSAYGNMILFCDGCNAAVHQSCYDVTELPKGDWFCNVCEDILIEKLGVKDILHVVPKEMSVAEGASEGDWEGPSCPILDRLHELRSQVYCCICGYSKGAMMPTLEPGKYAHVCCALWLPDSRVTNTHPRCAELHRVPVSEADSSAEAGVSVQPSVKPEVLLTQQVPTPSTQEVSASQQQLTPPQPTSTSQQPTSTSQQPLTSPQPSTPEQPSTPPAKTPHSPDGTVLIPLPSKVTAPPQNSQADTPAPPKPGFELVVSPYAHLRSHIDQNRYLVDLSAVKPQRKGAVCQLCRRRGGVVPCCSSGCNRYVHASCALRYELDMFWNNKIGHSGAPVDELLVDKDFFMHCFIHSGGNQGRGVPHKRAEGYRSPIGENEEVSVGRRRRKEDQGYVVPATPRPRRSRRREGLEASQAQGLELLRKKRERNKKKKERLQRERRAPREQPLAFTVKPRARYEVPLRRVVEWLRDSRCGPHLLNDEKNVVLSLQRRIDQGLLPRYSEWLGFTPDNATVQSFFSRCQRRQFFNLESVVTEIRVIYINLLAYLYLSPNPEDQAIASAVAEDAFGLTCLVTRLTDVERYREMMREPTHFYCLCGIRDGESQEYMVGCDGCGQWFHPFCIGYAETRYLNYLTTYGGKYVEVSEGKSFYCPKCCMGENAKKMELLTEAEVIARHAVRLDAPEAETVSASPATSVKEGEYQEKRVKLD